MSRGFKHRIYHEMKQFLFIALYLWVIFVYRAGGDADSGRRTSFKPGPKSSEVSSFSSFHKRGLSGPVISMRNLTFGPSSAHS
jgi:hypothetical protein